jgi:hypothetical protein
VTAAHVTMLLAAVSVGVNLRMVWLNHRRRGVYAVAWTATYALIATLSLIYAVAFAVLLYTDVDRAAWSEFLTPISAVSFLIVWILPATIAWLERKTTADLERTLRDA